jgi:predicted AAA+ superfamily ATPase
MTYDRLQQWFYKTIRDVPLKFKRYLWKEINWNARLIIITGARGVGKTTLMLQYIKEKLPINEGTLYARADDLYFNRYSIVELAEEFEAHNGRYLFIDEIHKYPNWSREIKNIYDQFPELTMVVTGSSTIEITKGEGDLSRRALFYHLQGLSFREYLEFDKGLTFHSLTTEAITNNPTELSMDITSSIRPLHYFEEYLKTGYFPFYKEDRDEYYMRINQIINTTLYMDIPASLSMHYEAVVNMKKLLGLITEMVPFKPNITKLSRQIGLSRESLVKYLQYLDKADLITLLYSSKKGISHLNKPEKIYLNNTNIIYAINPSLPNRGNLRETFFLNQFVSQGKVRYPEKGDFLIQDKYLFEVGGKNKSNQQIMDYPNAWIAADGIEMGAGRKIPLWLFGFLY